MRNRILSFNTLASWRSSIPSSHRQVPTRFINELQVLTVGRRDQLTGIRLRLLDALCIPLRCIEKIEGKLAELPRAVEQLPDTAEAKLASPLPEPGRESTVPARSRVVQLADKAMLCSAVTRVSRR